MPFGFSKSPLRVLLVVAAIVGAALIISVRDFVPQHPTGSVNAILNNLRKIEGAKELWAQKHTPSDGNELTREDLALFLPQDFWKKTVAGERYIINPQSVPPEALLTKGVQEMPTGTRLRFGRDGSIERILPN